MAAEAVAARDHVPPHIDPGPTGLADGVPSAHRASRWWMAYAALQAALLVALLLLPREGAWAAVPVLICWLAVGAILLGLRLHGSGRTHPWVLIGAGVAAYGFGNLLWYPSLVGVPAPLSFTDLSDVLFLGGYVLVIIGFALAGARLSGPSRTTDLLDALIAAAGLGSLTFLPLVDSYLVTEGGLSTMQRVVALAYPALDVVLLGAAMWAILRSASDRSHIALIAVYVGAQLTADLLWGRDQLLGTFGPASASPPLWGLSMLGIGAAALHPGLVRTADRAVLPGAVTRRRIGVLGVAAIAGPLGIVLRALLDLPQSLLLDVASLAIASLVIARLYGLAVDVRTHRAAQMRLEAARATYQNLVDNAPAVTWTARVVDAARGRAEDALLSPQFAELTGYQPEEFVGQFRWPDVVHPDDQAITVAFAQRIRDAAGGAGPTRYVDEYRLIRRDGAVRWVRDAFQIVLGADGLATAVHGVILDITEERAAQAALRASEARFRSLVDQIPGVVFLREVNPDGEGRLVYVSASSGRVLGRDAAEMLADGSTWAQIVEPEDMPALAEARNRHFRTATPATAVFRVVRQPERPDVARWIEVSWVKADDLGEGRWLSLGVALDVTVRQEAEIELRRVNADLEARVADRTAALATAQQEAEKASLAKSEFLSSMSHELRTPLNAILGFGQLLQMADLEPDDRQSADEVVRAGRHLLRMIEQVLDLTRIDAGRLTLSIEPVSLAPAVREAMDLALPAAQAAGVTLHDGTSEAPGLLALADGRRLGQILQNLLSNAIRYNRPGGNVWLSAEAGVEHVSIRVRDDGPGLPPDQLGGLFAPFEAAADGLPPGGLGLPLSARLARLMDGRLTASSVEGAGSTFELVLPIAAESPAVRGRRDGGTPAAPSTAARTILYIEDDLANLGFVERVLDRHFGARVLAAMQGRLGLEVARQHRPDLILLDVHLPDLPPLEALRALRADVLTQDIPIVVLSSDGGAERRQEMLALGANAFLLKPLDVPAFVTIVEDLLSAS